MTDEQTKLIAAAAAAAWSDGDLVPAERAQVLALARMLKVDDEAAVEALLVSEEAAQAALAVGSLGGEQALRLFSVALNVTLADGRFLEVEEYFLRKLAVRLGLSDETVDEAIGLARGGD